MKLYLRSFIKRKVKSELQTARSSPDKFPLSAFIFRLKPPTILALVTASSRVESAEQLLLTRSIL